LKAFLLDAANHVVLSVGQLAGDTMELGWLISLDGVGLIGVAFYIGSYAALQIGLLRGSGYPYTLLNLVAAILVLTSLTKEFNLSSAVIQITWIGISVVGLVRMALLARRAKLSSEETAFVARIFPGMSRQSARRLIDSGRWETLAPGTVIAEEGVVLGTLIYLAEGKVTVSVKGRAVGAVEAGGLIGEVTVMSKGPATATVTVEEPARIFRIGSAALRKIAASDGDLQTIIYLAFEAGMREKLTDADRRLAE
jgi:CRP-like cAMP-binding protein